MNNLCVCCGETIPEGRQVCYKCEVGKVKGYKEQLKQAHKETAEKFVKRLKELLDEREYKAGCSAHMICTSTAKECVDEIYKELTEGRYGDT